MCTPSEQSANRPPTTVRLLVAGRWAEPAGGGTYDLASPIDGRIHARIADATSVDVDRAVDAAQNALGTHRRRPVWERAELCRAIAAQLEARAEVIARAVTVETGRVLAGAHAEVLKAAEGFHLAGEEVLRLRGETIPVRDPHKSVQTHHAATGVWAVLTPWNFPVNIPVEYLGPAVASGNTVVWKPSPTASVSAALVLDCMVEAGLPDGVVNLITTQSVRTAEHLVSHPDVIGVALTGSSPTGRTVARAAAGKQLILELGGNGPVIVYADADLDRAAAAIAESCFMASGQLCSAGGRILTARTIAADLAERVGARVADYPLGDPFDPATVLGPLHTPELAARVSSQIHDARRRGAQIIAGGEASLDFANGQYFPATVLDRVDVAADINVQETFGPVAPIVPVDESDLIDLANAAEHALSAAVFTADADRAFIAAHDLQFGAVVINDRSSYWELHLPYGGWAGSASGQGRVGVPAVLRQMTQTKVIALHTTPAPLEVHLEAKGR